MEATQKANSIPLPIPQDLPQPDSVKIEAYAIYIYKHFEKHYIIEFDDLDPTDRVFLSSLGVLNYCNTGEQLELEMICPNVEISRLSAKAAYRFIIEDCVNCPESVEERWF